MFHQYLPFCLDLQFYHHYFCFSEIVAHILIKSEPCVSESLCKGVTKKKKDLQSGKPKPQGVSHQSVPLLWEVAGFIAQWLRHPQKENFQEGLINFSTVLPFKPILNLYLVSHLVTTWTHWKIHPTQNLKQSNCLLQVTEV